MKQRRNGFVSVSILEKPYSTGECLQWCVLSDIFGSLFENLNYYSLNLKAKISFVYYTIHEENLRVNTFYGKRRNFVEILCERLRQLRKERQVHQKDIADYLNITVRTYQYYESGELEPGLEKLVKIADLFEVSTDYLLGRVDKKVL